MSATAVPADRYGPPTDPRDRRRVTIALWALGAVGVAVAVWLGLLTGRAPVTWQEVGFHIDGATQVDVTYAVSRPDPSVGVTCRIEAQSRSHAQVGVVLVDVPGASERTVRLTTIVRTSEQAVTGIVNECWVPGG